MAQLTPSSLDFSPVVLISKCLVIIPARNESQGIQRLVTAVRSHIPKVLVVDDGSQDDTAESARNAGAIVISTNGLQGKGAALRKGWIWAAEKGFEWCLCMDADGQHSPEDITAFLEASEMEGAMVAGNRMTCTQSMPAIRRFTNRFMSWVLSVSAGQKLPDSQCGFRLLKVSEISDLRLKTTHFEIESEVILALARRRLQIKWVEINTIYGARPSHIRVWRDTYRWVKWFISQQISWTFERLRGTGCDSRPNKLQAALSTREACETAAPRRPLDR